MIACPVCPRSDIPDNSALCPGCGADLTPLQRVRGLCVAHFNEALRLAEAGIIDTALARLGSALTLDERFVPARTLLGKLLWKTDQRRAAMRQWEQAAKLSPESSEPKQLLRAAYSGMWWHRLRWCGAIMAAILVMASVTLIASWLTGRMASDAMRNLRADAAAREELHAAQLIRLEASLASMMSTVSQFSRVSQQLADYRLTHGRSDAEYAAVVDSVERAHREVTDMRALMTQEQNWRDRAFSELGALQGQLSELENRGREANAALGNALQERHVAIAATLDALRDRLAQLDLAQRQLACDTSLAATVSAADNRRLREGLVELLRAMRPTRAESLAVEIAELNGKHAELCELEKGYQSESGQPFNATKLAWVRARIRSVEGKLRPLLADFTDHIAPLERGLKALMADDEATTSVKPLTGKEAEK